VLLISGPTSIPIPEDVDFLPVETAADMHTAVCRHLGRMDVAVFAAAVADYTPANVAEQKLKKTGEALTLELVRTPDILGGARANGFTGTLVGFAAETENLEANAREKLAKKSCDLVIANDVSQPGIGFDSDRNEVLMVYPDRTVALPADEKEHLAIHLVEAILALAADRTRP
ncbi:MAG TPA: phosphopantothenoylcysteine decarboxylase, partial [Luteolibacter sp.]